METAPFMSGWDDPNTVAERLGPALQSRGLFPSHSIQSCDASPLGGHSGLSGDLSSLTLTLQEDDNGRTSSTSSTDADNADNADKVAPKTPKTPKTLQLVLKRTRSSEEARHYSKKLGLQREGTFYKTIGPWVQQKLDKASTSLSSLSSKNFIPTALFAAYDDETGEKAIVLEYFDDATEAGVFFPHSVHNVARKMEEERKANEDGARTDSKGGDPSCQLQTYGITSRSITLEAARIAASLHGSFFQDPSLLQTYHDKSSSSENSNHSITSHLRMADWIQGRNKETFLSSQQEVCDRWQQAKALWEKNDFFGGQVEMEKRFVEIMDKSCSMALDFNQFVQKWNTDYDSKNSVSGTSSSVNEGQRIRWSLVHGDYHPGNLICLHPTKAADDSPKSDITPELILVDWEVVGVGSGPQDIGQFLISHFESQEAYDILDEVTSTYHESLLKTLEAVNPSQIPNMPSLEEVKREIVYGGLERWVWLFGYMCGMLTRMPLMYMQYFHDQVYGWIVKNDISPENVGMPRP